jgi:hypothetical protein
VASGDAREGFERFLERTGHERIHLVEIDDLGGCADIHRQGESVVVAGIGAIHSGDGGESQGGGGRASGRIDRIGRGWAAGCE